MAGKPVTVTQAGTTGCEYRVTPERAIFDKEAGSQPLTITLPAGCTGKGWGASSTDKWIKVQDFTGGVAGGTVKVTVLENGEYKPRVGSVTVAGKRREIVQYGKRPCSYLTVPGPRGNLNPSRTTRALLGFP